jgi:DNA-directed RNA polymerase specialized sigma subunit
VSKRPLSAHDGHDVAEIAEQVRTVPELDSDKVAALLDQVRAGEAPSARQRLVENYLRIALSEADARADRGVEVGDLFQEATLAVMVAVHEFALRDAPASGLAEFTRRVVAAHLDATVDAAEIEQRGEAAFVRDAQLYEVAEVGLRRRLGREATSTEVASLLDWPAERAEAMAGMLTAARQQYDGDIALYLDDD